jgi:signal transduction histidine kinase
LSTNQVKLSILHPVVMMQTNQKISVQELSKAELSKAKNRLLVYSCLLITPLYFLILFYGEHRSNNAALEPIIKQLSQSISIGDGITLERTNKSILLLPRVKASKVTLNDGYCAIATAEQESAWNREITEPCQTAFASGIFVLSKQIQNTENETIGKIEVEFSPPWNFLILIPFIALASLLLVYYLFKTTTQSIFAKLTTAIETFPEMIRRNEDAEFELRELQNTYNELKRLKKIEMDHFKNTAMNTMAAQVSHDIRSPLAALEMISGSLHNIPEEKRLIIRNSVNRIRDIANELLNLNKKIKRESIATTDQVSTSTEEINLHLLSPLIDSITTEKRIQYRNRMNITIEYHQCKESYGMFSNIRANEFKSVLSNLVNNSVESIEQETGHVEISMRGLPDSSQSVEIRIRDNGRGIPVEIIPDLGKEKKSHNKESGNGLGLYHAFRSIESMGGNISIRSSLGIGTEVIITLPRRPAPKWFVPELNLSTRSAVIIMDDDASVHQIWKDRLDPDHHSGLTMHHFTTASDLKEFYRKNFSDLDDCVFLVDFEISKNLENGLDLIEQLGIADSSILVTSRFEEKHIRERCDRLNVKLIPKSMSGFIPIHIQQHTKIESSPGLTLQLSEQNKKAPGDSPKALSNT